MPEYRSSSRDLKTCTRFRAMIARRTRRSSSSLLPLNITPAMTSIQPPVWWNDWLMSGRAAVCGRVVVGRLAAVADPDRNVPLMAPHAEEIGGAQDAVVQLDAARQPRQRLRCFSESLAHARANEGQQRRFRFHHGGRARARS